MTGYKSKRAAAQDKLDSMEREALKMALEALEGFIPYLPLWDKNQCNRYDLATTAIKATLAQPAQKPVAWLEPEWGEKICPEVGYEVTMTDDHPRDLCWIPLYAQRPWVMQREWVDLTEDEIDKWAHELHGVIYAVMADLKEKNNG